MEVPQKCRNITAALHFKTWTIKDEMAAASDKKIVNDLQQKAGYAISLLDLDEQFSSSIPEEAESAETGRDDATPATTTTPHHSHSSLKSACPTRWNSTLEMVDSIVQLKRKVQNALKRTGDPELCLHNDELDFMTELVSFLKPYRDLTDLFSSTMPTLSVIPLMKLPIKKNCVVAPGDDEKIKCVKEAVLAKLDYRFPETETVKLHQLLDTEMKDLLPRQEASRVLEDAINLAYARGSISALHHSCMSVYLPALRLLRLAMKTMQPQDANE